MVRAYKSEVRDARAADTREHLLTCARAMLAEGGVDEVTLPRLAARAEVSVPTVYRHFATMDALFDGLLAWLRPHVGMTPEQLQRAPEEVPELPRDNFPRFEEWQAVLRPLMDSTAFNRVRVSSQADRLRGMREMLRPAAPAWRDEDLGAVAGAIFMLGSPQAWRWLRDTAGVDAGQAARGCAWAMQVLVAALNESDGLGPKPKAKKRRSK